MQVNGVKLCSDCTVSEFCFRAEKSCNIRSSFTPRIELLHGKPLPSVTTAPILVVISYVFLFWKARTMICEYTWALMFDKFDLFCGYTIQNV